VEEKVKKLDEELTLLRERYAQREYEYKVLWEDNIRLSQKKSNLPKYNKTVFFVTEPSDQFKAKYSFGYIAEDSPEGGFIVNRLYPTPTKNVTLKPKDLIAFSDFVEKVENAEAEAAMLQQQHTRLIDRLKRLIEEE
jgi:hypothetical protein